MKKLSKIFITLIAFLCIGACSACKSSCAKKYYYDYHVIWYCDEPYIVFEGDRHYGFMQLDGKNYMLDIAWQAHGSKIYFYDGDKIEGSASGDFLIWEADTEIKDGLLIFTIIKDNVSDYDGKTIVFNQRPVEDDN